MTWKMCEWIIIRVWNTIPWHFISMNSYEISYSKYNINVFPHQYGYYLNVIFEYSENKYLVTKITNQIILILKITDCYVT